MEILVASIILIVVMLFFVYLMFKSIIKRINQNSKKYFVNKLNDYNYIVEEKEKKIQELNKEIDELTEIKVELEKKEITRPHLQKRTEIKQKPINNNKLPKYREENFFFNYKELRNNFDFDKEELIRKFIKEHQDRKDEKQYKILVNFKRKFDKEGIYQLMTLPGKEQMEILEKILTEKEKQLIDMDEVEKENGQFSIMLLFKKIDEMLIKVNPIMSVYVSKYDKNYDYIDPYIRTKHYSRMSEGLIIEYKGKSYDFSI